MVHKYAINVKPNVHKDAMSQAIDIINRLMRSVGVTTKVALADKLGVRPSGVTNAIRLKEIPEAWLYKVGYLTGRNVEWLRTGRGEELAGHLAEGRSTYQILPPGPRHDLAVQLDRYLLSAPQEEADSLQRLLHTLTDAAPDTRQHIIGQLKLLERMTAAEKELAKLSRLKRGEGAQQPPPAGQAAG